MKIEIQLFTVILKFMHLVRLQHLTVSESGYRLILIQVQWIQLNEGPCIFYPWNAQRKYKHFPLLL